MRTITFAVALLPLVLAVPFSDDLINANNDESAIRANIKRASEYPKTDVTIGDHKIYWGCNVDPIKELDHLSDVCKTSGQCLESSEDAYELEIDWLDPSKGDKLQGKPLKKKLRITGTGRYEIPMRNGLVKAVQQAAGAKGVIKWYRDVKYQYGQTCAGMACVPNPGSGKCDIAELSTVIGINLYKTAGANNANSIQAQIEIVDANDSEGFCKALDYSAAVTGAFGQVGAGFAAIFGTIKAFCPS